MRRRLAYLAPVLVLALLLGACSLVGPDGDLTLTATFDDVIDLVPQADVRAGDVPIGTVDAIELTPDNRAKVTMSVRDDTGLPANTVAYLSKTSLLGERYVDLRPPDDQTPTGTLTDGEELTDTRMITDFEELVKTGGDLLAYTSADRLAAAIQTGVTAFSGEGSVLGSFLDDVESFVGRYDNSKDDLLNLIDSLDRFSAAYAPNATDNAAVLADLQKASDAFQTVDTKLLDTLDRLSDMSDISSTVLTENQQELQNFIRRLRKIVGQLTRIDGALDTTLTWFPRHNIWVPKGEYDEETQVFLDFIVCGLTETDGDPTRDCTPPNGGQPGQDPGYYPYPEACWDDPAKCPDEPQGG